MEGPSTPVSALIHAATMVVAGVFLVARLFPIYVTTPEVLTFITAIGAVTALYAAVCGLCSDRYKTCACIFHDFTDRFYDSGFGCNDRDERTWCIGLYGFDVPPFHPRDVQGFAFPSGAGAIIHAVHSNEMSEYWAGYGNICPLPDITFLIACLAIAVGIPPFSGFFSKDEILAAPSEECVWGVWMSLVAGLTAFYMFRLYFKIL